MPMDCPDDILEGFVVKTFDRYCVMRFEIWRGWILGQALLSYLPKNPTSPNFDRYCVMRFEIWRGWILGQVA